MSFCDNYTLTRTFTGSRDTNTQGGKAVSFTKRFCDTAEIKKGPSCWEPCERLKPDNANCKNKPHK